MFNFKMCLVFFTLFIVSLSVSKPTEEYYYNEGRGIASTVWGWITYPFYWWSSDETQPPVTEPLIGLPDPSGNIPFGSHNVTVWCNDQICTTMKCNITHCRNITCNLYDTNLSGECREYNILDEPVDKPVSEPEQHIQASSTETTTKQHSSQITDTTKHSSETTESITQAIQSSTVVVPKDKEKAPAIEDHPLELEAVLSSTINSQNTEKVVHEDQ